MDDAVLKANGSLSRWWAPWVRLTALSVGVGAFALIVFLQVHGTNRPFWFMGLALTIYGCIVLNARMRALETGKFGDPPWADVKPVAVSQELRVAREQAHFVPEKLWGPQKLSAPSILLIVIGLPLVLAGFTAKGLIVAGLGIFIMVLGFWINPRQTRGHWQGRCPHCRQTTSAFQHAIEFECPHCEQMVIRDGTSFLAPERHVE